jgi:hypothetical protein
LYTSWASIRIRTSLSIEAERPSKRGCAGEPPGGVFAARQIFHSSTDLILRTQSITRSQVSICATLCWLSKQEWWGSLKSSTCTASMHSPWAGSVEDGCPPQEAAPWDSLALEAKRCRGPAPWESIPHVLAVREWRSSKARQCRDITLVTQLTLER